MKKPIKFETYINIKNKMIEYNGLIISNNTLNIIEKAKKISGILKENELENYISRLIPYSFIFWAEIELINPYFSKDDEDYNLTKKNLCIKDKAFKIPMIRGSAWKGVFANAFKILINESLFSSNTEEKAIDYIQSFARIFGTGSMEFRKFTKMLSELLEDKLKEKDMHEIIKYLIFELGLRLKKDDIDNLRKKENFKDWVRNNIWKKYGETSEKNLPFFLKPHKGRAIFYPTFFSRLSTEVINPHSKEERKGKGPIFFEVVSKYSRGIVQIVYIPFDGIRLEREVLKDQVEKDVKFIELSFKKVSDIGIGAKSKLGWGRFTIKSKKLKFAAMR
ncbi:crispr-associated ramp protein [Thermosipho africanus TCF52B]|uniref:Crispr-associated ramp protein n=1 Tax=Thermosipho africanus (strain TCF52B) TaxID=484019 RepID=B7IGV4_THEAB|nr:RAMP superfamily CRISPR-associated protein [Thermosipho africanus]ACJ75318.1 crispr-associated ramp protein [Thermosipho africanus TCF52B]